MIVAIVYATTVSKPILLQVACEAVVYFYQSQPYPRRLLFPPQPPAKKHAHQGKILSKCPLVPVIVLKKPFAIKSACFQIYGNAELTLFHMMWFRLFFKLIGFQYAGLWISSLINSVPSAFAKHMIG